MTHYSANIIYTDSTKEEYIIDITADTRKALRQQVSALKKMQNGSGFVGISAEIWQFDSLEAASQEFDSRFDAMRNTKNIWYLTDNALSLFINNGKLPEPLSKAQVNREEKRTLGHITSFEAPPQLNNHQPCLQANVIFLSDNNSEYTIDFSAQNTPELQQELSQFSQVRPSLIPQEAEIWEYASEAAAAIEFDSRFEALKDQNVAVRYLTAEEVTHFIATGELPAALSQTRIESEEEVYRDAEEYRRILWDGLEV